LTVRLPIRPQAHPLRWVLARRNPSALITFKIVAKLGLPSLERALYRLSRPSPVSFANCAMPLDRAITPNTCALQQRRQPNHSGYACLSQLKPPPSARQSCVTSYQRDSNWQPPQRTSIATPAIPQRVGIGRLIASARGGPSPTVKPRFSHDHRQAAPGGRA